MRRIAQSGVTLVEILVVLTMVGILAGVAVVALGGADRRSDGKAEAQRLADRLNLAVDEALVTGMPLVLRWDETSYRFESWDATAAEWQRHPVELLGQPHRLSSSLRLQAEQSGGHATQQRLAIRPGGSGDPARLSIVGGSNDWLIIFDGLSASALPPRG